MRPFVLAAALLAAIATPARAHAQDVSPLTAIRQAAEWYRVDTNYLYQIARCESGLRPYAVSPNGAYRGLFQFSAPAWQWASAQAGYAGASRYDAEASAMAAAWLLRQPGGARHWPVCAAGGRRW